MKNMKDIMVKIQFLIPSLPRAEKAIAVALAEHPEAITYMTLSEISKESGSSEASVIRFCKRMGFSGYSTLQQAIAEAMEGENESHAEELQVSHEDSMYEIIQKVYQSNVQTLTDTMILVSEQCERALEALLSARSIHFFGAGDAYAVCQLAYMKFKRLGIPCSAEGDIMLQMITASNMTKGDVAIAISYDGRSKNVVEALRIAKQMGATTISITKKNKTPLLRYTDIKLFIAVNDLSFDREKVTRRVADQFIMDALYMGYVMRSGRNYKKQLKKTQIAIDGNKI